MISALKSQKRPPNPMPSRPQGGAKSAGADKIRVLIADDHVTVTAGLAAIIGLQGDMTVVAEAAHGREAVDLWRKHRPDVALLDLRMPVLDGVGATLLARGKSNKEIGMNLYISETTVKAHLRTIFTKLNVLSRTEAIAAASRRGLVQL